MHLKHWSRLGRLVVLIAVLPCARAAEPLADLPALIDRTRAAFDVPGIAVAVVQDGERIWSGGSGLREVGRAEPVDADTLFAIASLTKAFTATALSILADEGKLQLSDRVIDHLPGFAMSDPYVSREMTLRDLLSHRSGLGLGAGDLLFWPATDYSTTEIVARLRTVPLNSSFRSAYAYDNILYAVAKQVIEKVSGQDYFTFLQQRIFAPAGLTSTRVNADHLLPGDDNVAIGHAKFDFKALRPVPPMTWANNAAAGGLYSSANDLARWMQIHLAAGALPGHSEDAPKRLLSANRHAAMWELITPMPIRPPTVPELAAATPQFAGYGEGWVISDYRGERMVWHTGGWPGMVSRITLIPARKLGVVVLTNQEVGAAFHALTYSVLDRLLDAPPSDWIGAYAKSVEAARDKADTQWQAHQAARVRGTRPSLPLPAYAGTYRDRWYGDVELRIEGKSLVMQFSRTAQLFGTLEHWQHDTFIVRWRDRSLNADAFASFALDPDGKVRELRMQAISSLTDFSFDFHDLQLLPLPASPTEPH